MALLKNTVINDVGAITLPRGTTAQRPTTPPEGSLRYNSDLGYTECYYQGFWFDISTGRGLPKGSEDHVILLDASLAASTNGTTSARWLSLAENRYTGRHFDFYGSPTYTSDGLKSYWRFDTSDHAACENTCNDLDYNSVEVVFRRYTNSGNILYNKESCWEVQTSSNDFQWAWQTTDRSWYWSSTGGINTSDFYHSVVTYDGNRVRAYVNGRLRQTDNNYNNGVLQNQPNNYPKINGRSDPRTTATSLGSHDVAYFAVYDRPLDDMEVLHNYQACAERFELPYNPYN
jgi:hypothetical protein